MTRREEAERMVEEMIDLQAQVDTADSSNKLKAIEQELVTKMFQFARHVLLDFVYGPKE